MALGKHLFSFRTQKLSPVAASILRKREISTVPNYKKSLRIGEIFSYRKYNKHVGKIVNVISIAFFLRIEAKNNGSAIGVRLMFS